MSDNPHNEIQNALDSISDAELIEIVTMPSPWAMAQDALRHNQHLVKVPNSPSTPLIAVSGHCIITGVTWQTIGFSEEVLFKGLRLWAMGQPAQSALHFMSAEEREFLISGMSPDGWAATFPEEPGDREPFFPPTL